MTFFCHTYTREYFIQENKKLGGINSTSVVIDLRLCYYYVDKAKGIDNMRNITSEFVLSDPLFAIISNSLFSILFSIQTILNGFFNLPYTHLVLESLFLVPYYVIGFGILFLSCIRIFFSTEYLHNYSYISIVSGIFSLFWGIMFFSSVFQNPFSMRVVVFLFIFISEVWVVWRMGNVRKWAN